MYYLSAKGDNSLWKKIVLQGFTYIYQLRETIYFLGELIVFLGFRSHCPLYKWIATKCVDHIDLPALILNLHQLLHHLTAHLLSDLQLQFQLIFPLFQQFGLQIFYCFKQFLLISNLDNTNHFSTWHAIITDYSIIILNNLTYWRKLIGLLGTSENYCTCTLPFVQKCRNFSEVWYTFLNIVRVLRFYMFI